ncbi:transposase family protein [Nonomuraea jiangxiensis]|uniref:transposase family protein n=1 Tax=Nonomuraea jiangxiensis TaxID=633440 RepID=UPI0015A26B9A
MILDGTLIPIDRCAEQTISVNGESIDAWYSGKAHQHAGNLQALSAPDGLPLWIGEVEPGSVHDMSAARARTEGRVSVHGSGVRVGARAEHCDRRPWMARAFLERGIHSGEPRCNDRTGRRPCSVCARTPRHTPSGLGTAGHTKRDEAASTITQRHSAALKDLASNPTVAGSNPAGRALIMS